MAERFARHELIPGWEQERLHEAVVVIVGVGALGNEAARILALAGVGALILCDPDRVAESNLSRTPLFGARDVGRFKVEAAAEALKDLAPGLRVESRPARLIHGVGLAELRDAALVLSCLDSREARLQLAGRCNLVRAPLLDAGTNPWGGEVRPYLDPNGPCYGCGLSEGQRAVSDTPWSCAEVISEGASAPIAAIVAGWQALIAVRYLMRLPTPAGLLHIDGTSGTTRVVEHERNPDCPLHEPLEDVRKVKVCCTDRVSDLRAAVAANEIPLLWEAVTRSAECPRCGFATDDWLLTLPMQCPNCAFGWQPWTTLELHEAPGKLCLRELGVPPRDILAVRTPDDQKRYVELSA